MFGFRRLALCALGLTGFGLTVWAWSGTAQPTDPANLHPERSIAYLVWDGSKAHEGAISETAQYKALVESGLFDYVLRLANQSMGVILSQVGPGGPEGAAMASGVKDTLMSLYENGLSVSVTDSHGQIPSPMATLVIHNGADSPQIVQMLLMAMDIHDQPELKTVSRREVNYLRNPSNPDIELAWWAEAEHLVIAIGEAAPERVIAVADGEASSVTENDLWQRCRSEDNDFEVAAAAWLHIKPLRERFGGMPLPIPNSPGPVTINQLAEGLGLANLNAVGGHFGYRGRATVSHSFSDAPGPRTGLLAMVDQKPFTLADLPPLPPDCFTFGAFSLNTASAWDTTLQTLQTLARLAPPEASGELDEALTQLPQLLGLDLRDDLLSGLGTVHCFYNDPAGGPFGMGFGVALSVEDPEKLNRAISLLRDRSAQQLQQIPSPTPLMIQESEADGRRLLTLPAGILTPTIGLGEKWLVMGLYPQSVKAFFMREDGKLPRWEPSAEHQEALAELPKSFTSISIDDPRKGLKALYGFVPMINSAVHSFAPGFGPEAVKAAELPPQEVVTAPLFPNVSVSVADEAGTHYYTRTSLPFTPIPAAESGVAVPVLVALLLPAVQQARSAARRTQSKNNLKQLGLAMHNYHDVYGHLPFGTEPDTELDAEERLGLIYAILPFIEEAAIYDQLRQFSKKAWNSEDSAHLTSVEIPVLLNPGLPADLPAATHYIGIAGVGEDAPELPVRHERAGLFGINRKTRFRDVTDGLSNTAMMTETTETDIPWAAGAKGIRALTQEPYINGPDGIGGPYPGGCNVLFADGSVRFISENIDPETMRRIAAMADGKPLGIIP